MNIALQSLCYQLPAIVSDAITLVISPLISLAKDQVDNWNARGASIDALAYNCTVPSYVKEKVLHPSSTFAVVGTRNLPHISRCDSVTCPEALMMLSAIVFLYAP